MNLMKLAVMTLGKYLTSLSLLYQIVLLLGEKDINYGKVPSIY